jgi:hypothetical protein
MMKGIVTVILLAFVAVSVIYMAVGQRGEGNVAAPNVDVAPTSVTEAAQDSTGAGAEMQDVAEGVEVSATAANIPGETAAKTQEPPTVPRTVVAYYFHRTQRCTTCLTMEAYAEDALREGLPDAFESGELEWHAINVEEPKHEHFVKEYDLYASALVMAEMEGGEVKRSKNLERIWDLVGDESKFKVYVRDEALAYLEDAP